MSQVVAAWSRCAQCGHDHDGDHTGPGGMCRAMSGLLQCKCKRFVDPKERQP